MKHKYLIKNSENKDKFVIVEYAELDKALFSMVFENEYDKNEIKQLIAQGGKSLINGLRTPEFYPISSCAERIAAGVETFFNSPDNEAEEILYDDAELIVKNEKDPDEIDSAADDVEIDDLLDDDNGTDDEKLLEDEEIKAISNSTSSIKIADVEDILVDDESKA